MSTQVTTAPADSPQSVAPAPSAPATVTFDKRGCAPLLRKHPTLETRVTKAVEGQLANGLFKSKFATTLRWQGLPLWECRVNEKSVGAVRAAFVVQGARATVLYLSTTLQKRAFTTELERFLERGPR